MIFTTIPWFSSGAQTLGDYDCPIGLGKQVTLLSLLLLLIISRFFSLLCRLSASSSTFKPRTTFRMSVLTEGCLQLLTTSPQQIEFRPALSLIITQDSVHKAIGGICHVRDGRETTIANGVDRGCRSWYESLSQARSAVLVLTDSIMPS